MTSEVRSNGSTQIRLVGERPIEKQAIAEILDAARDGQTIRIQDGGDGELVMELEH